MFLSVVIPAYNEELNIPVIIEKIKFNLLNCCSISDFEIIICDDHSNDLTFETVRLINDKKIKAIRLSRRSGSHRAIRAGLNFSKGDVVLCISADGQDDVGIIEKMIEKIKMGSHIVWGVRESRDEPLFSKIFALFFYKLLNLFVPNEKKVDLANADFYMLHRKVVDSINLCKESNTSLFGLIAWIGFKQESVKYVRNKRVYGKSKWSFKSKLKLTLDWIIAFSGIPLKLISILGLVFAFIGFLYAIFIIFLSVSGKTTPGWAENVILILIIGGIQMIMMGVLGEYLLRTFDESRKRPLYFIEESENII
jgi:glycosyltransferase involved in cell wall biosynthesis